jgi:hypothetical protein
MEQKHTQGEWVVHPIGNAWLPPFVKVAKFHPGAGAYQIIADCSHETTSGIDCEANARLIAAAPDLLDAARLLPTHWLDSGVLQSPRTDVVNIRLSIEGTSYEHTFTVGELREAARAIAKAEGQP